MRLRAIIATLLLTGCGLRVGAPSAAALPSRFPASDGRTPYATTASWFGHLAPDAPAESDTAQEYLYLWIPNAAPELGVRVVSPVAGWTTPGEGDLLEPGFAERAGELTGFDPSITFERCLNAMNPEDLLVQCEYWALLGENDDSSELPPPPGTEAKTHALLRAVSEPDEPLRALIRGLYRVGIAPAKGTAPQGTYWLQVGAARDFGPILIARTPGELAAQIP